MIGNRDPDPGRQRRLQLRAMAILNTAMEWLPQPPLVLANISMPVLQQRAKAFAAICNFLADNPVIMDALVVYRGRETDGGEDGEEWEGFPDDGDDAAVLETAVVDKESKTSVEEHKTNVEGNGEESKG